MSIALILKSVARAWLYLRGPSEVDYARFTDAVGAAQASGLIGTLVFQRLSSIEVWRTSQGFELGSRATSMALAMAVVAVELSRPMRAHTAASAGRTFGHELRVSIPRSLYQKAKLEAWRLNHRSVVDPVSPLGRPTALEFIRRFMIRAYFLDESPKNVDRDRLSRAARAAHQAGLIGDVILDILTGEFNPRAQNTTLALATAIADATLSREIDSAAREATELLHELRASVPWMVYSRARREMSDRLSDGGE